MTLQNKFLSGTTVIKLNQVVDVVQPPNTNFSKAESVWLMVMLEDGTFTTIKGRAETEAFMQAMDHYLGSDLI